MFSLQQGYLVTSFDRHAIVHRAVTEFMAAENDTF